MSNPDNEPVEVLQRRFKHAQDKHKEAVVTFLEARKAYEASIINEREREKEVLRLKADLIWKYAVQGLE